MKLLSATLLAAILILTGLFVHRDQESDTLNDQTRPGVVGSFVRLPHGTVHYQLAGPESGRTVVLVHGFSVPYYIWDPTYDELVKKGFRVLRYDLYGRGYSDRPDEVYGPDLYRMGVISACVPADTVVDEAHAIAAEIAAKSPLAVGAAKRSFNVTEDLPLRDGYRYEQDMTAQIGKTADAKEAQLAFAEKLAAR